VQATVDAQHKLIADFKVINKPNDLGQLAPMALRTKKILGNENFTVLADKGYYQAHYLNLKPFSLNSFTHTSTISGSYKIPLFLVISSRATSIPKAAR
jgi:hypothetical protein